MKESEVVKACMDWLLWRGIFHWRQNTTGVFNPKSGGYFFHGKKGVSDILGILEQSVDVNLGSKACLERFGCLLAIECKGENGRVSDDQIEFLGEVNKRGGLGIVVRSVTELEEKLKDYL